MELQTRLEKCLEAYRKYLELETLIGKISLGSLEDAGFGKIIYNYIDDIIYQICPDASDSIRGDIYCIMYNLINYNLARIAIKGQLKTINNTKELLEVIPYLGEQ